MTFGHSISIPVSSVQLKLYRFKAYIISLVRTQTAWELCQPVGASPAPRTGHACVTYQDRIIVYVPHSICINPYSRFHSFGGTDGQYHYNDTWSYDTNTRTWTELQCIGFIPSPREGHAAAVVDDVIYVFGGRGVDGKDLGDLAAFKMSSAWSLCKYMHDFELITHRPAVVHVPKHGSCT